MVWGHYKINLPLVLHCIMHIKSKHCAALVLVFLYHYQLSWLKSPRIPRQYHFEPILWFTMKDNYVFKYLSNFGQFFANSMFIFHKTEIQTVIIRCLTGINLDWFKSYDTKCKYRFPFAVFCNFVQKHSFAFFAFLCHIFCTN